jgi:hypothetical protein
MGTISRLLLATAVSATLADPAVAQQRPTGDKDDQIVITGCVIKSDPRLSGPRSILFWSRGDVYLDPVSADIKPSEHAARPIGTSGKGGPIVYWIDDDDDFSRHANKRVEIVGELSEIEDGEIEIEPKGALTEIEFEWDGDDVTARVPSAWLSPFTPAREASFDVAVRRVDVEKVTVLAQTCD